VRQQLERVPIAEVRRLLIDVVEDIGAHAIDGGIVLELDVQVVVASGRSTAADTFYRLADQQRLRLTLPARHGIKKKINCAARIIITKKAFLIFLNVLFFMS